MMEALLPEVMEEREVRADNAPSIEGSLVTACMNRGIVAQMMGEDDLACELYDRGIQIQEQLIARRPHPENRDALALLLLNKASLLQRIGRSEEAQALSQDAIDIWEELVHEAGRLGWLHRLAAAQVNATGAHLSAGDMDRGLESAEKAVAILDWLVSRDGCADYRRLQAAALLSLACVWVNRGDGRRVEAVARRAERRYGQLLEKDGFVQVEGEWAMARATRSIGLLWLEREAEALPMARESLALIDGLIASGQRPELGYSMAQLREKLDSFLSSHPPEDPPGE